MGNIEDHGTVGGCVELRSGAYLQISS
jgi:hypothetical protein